jgi:hypothetical protein
MPDKVHGVGLGTITEPTRGVVHEAVEAGNTDEPKIGQMRLIKERRGWELCESAMRAEKDAEQGEDTDYARFPHESPRRNMLAFVCHIADTQEGRGVGVTPPQTITHGALSHVYA